MRSHPGHKQEKTAQSALKATLINASFKVAEVSHSYIDLTISDSEDDYTRPAREADEAAALESTKRLAALLPDVLADTPPKIGPAHPDSLRASAALEARPGVEPTGSSAPRLDKIRNAKKRTLGKAHQNDTQFRAPVPAQEESYPDPGKDPQHSDNAEDNYTENSTVDVTSKRLRDTLPFYESRVLPLRLLISPEKSVTPGEDDEDERHWKKSGVDLAMEFANVYALARDLPHDAQDRVNSLDDVARRGSQLILFESLMSENTASDEPGAPDIKVINDVDDELTPPFEFHYSNLMWHSDNVPRPDLDHLRSCECHGSCSADAKKCACVIGIEDSAWKPKYCIDAYHAGNFTRYLASLIHPCYINEGNIEKPLLAIFTRKDIAVGQELCFSYTGPPDDDDDNEEENNNPKAVEDDDIERNDAIYVKCRCGTRRCKGKMWL
ncbi:hypothetical protein EW026_g2504 [Hermanssonia centrifuga]|uniref:Post-SET domain-containing protein n=1 Tax=Hermanssonia centrifuga TaxID=98765 RepID=A0A4S4KN13_9APHY|nr:hypothetical protein EW026_g2504 [Hermanssonia centrifuga]